MEEFLIKLNGVKTHNQIVGLKKQCKEKDKKITEVMDGSKKIVLEYQEKNEERFRGMEEKINRLQEERDFYKSSFEKIPSFVRNIFIPKNKRLSE